MHRRRNEHRNLALQVTIFVLCVYLMACQSWFGGPKNATSSDPEKANRSIEELRQDLIDNPSDADAFATLAKAMPIYFEIRFNHVRAALETAESIQQLKEINENLDQEAHGFAEGLAFVQQRCRCSEEDFKIAYDDFIEQMGYKKNMIEVAHHDIEVKQHKFYKNSQLHGENAVLTYHADNMEEARNQAILALQYNNENQRAKVVLAKTELYFEGENLVAAHRIEAAIKHFENTLKLCKKNPDPILSANAAKQLQELRAKRKTVNRMLARADRLLKLQKFEKARANYKATLQRNEEFSEIIEQRLKGVQWSEMAKVQERAKNWDEALVLYTKVKDLLPGLTFVNGWIKKVRYHQDLKDARDALKLAQEAFDAGKLDESVGLLKRAIQRYPDKKTRKKETKKLVRKISNTLKTQASKEKSKLLAWRLYGLCNDLGGSGCSGKFRRLDRKIRPQLTSALKSGKENWATRLTAASLLLEVDSDHKSATLVHEETLDYPARFLDFSFPTSFELVGYSAYGDLPDITEMDIWREFFVEELSQNNLRSVPGAPPLKVQVQVVPEPRGEVAFATDTMERGIVPGKEKLPPPGLLFLVGPTDNTVVDSFWLAPPSEDSGWTATAVPSIQKMGKNVVNWVNAVDRNRGREAAIRSSMRRWRLTHDGQWNEAPFEQFWRESQP